MKLIEIPINDEALKAWAPHWLPFLPLIAKRSKETLLTLFKRVTDKEIRLVLVWDEKTEQAVALIGFRLTYRNQNELIGELLWTTGSGRQSWEHLLPDLEQILRDAGCVECWPFCRPGWSRILKQHGYKLTHYQMEKVL